MMMIAMIIKKYLFICYFTFLYSFLHTLDVHSFFLSYLNKNKQIYLRLNKNLLYTNNTSTSAGCVDFFAPQAPGGQSVLHKQKRVNGKEI